MGLHHRDLRHDQFTGRDIEGKGAVGFGAVTTFGNWKLGLAAYAVAIASLLVAFG